MKIMKKKFLILCVGASIAVFMFTVGAISLAIGGIAVFGDNSFMTTSKEKILVPMIEAGKSEAVGESLQCFSMVTGINPKDALVDLSHTLADDKVADRAIEIAASLPEKVLEKDGNFLEQIQECYSILRGQA